MVCQRSLVIRVSEALECYEQNLPDASVRAYKFRKLIRVKKIRIKLRKFQLRTRFPLGILLETHATHVCYSGRKVVCILHMF